MTPHGPPPFFCSLYSTVFDEFDPLHLVHHPRSSVDLDTGSQEPGVPLGASTSPSFSQLTPLAPFDFFFFLPYTPPLLVFVQAPQCTFAVFGKVAFYPRFEISPLFRNPPFLVLLSFSLGDLSPDVTASRSLSFDFPYPPSP